MEGSDEQLERSPQEAEAAANHLDWRCDHIHNGPGAPRRGPAPSPHRHLPFQQETLDLDGDLLGFNPVRWSIEWAGRDLRCRGIEVVARQGVDGWQADPGNPIGNQPVAARVSRRL
jgi:hypothetical protein